jgi:hypothetical protein
MPLTTINMPIVHVLMPLTIIMMLRAKRMHMRCLCAQNKALPARCYQLALTCEAIQFSKLE